MKISELIEILENLDQGATVAVEITGTSSQHEKSSLWGMETPPFPLHSSEVVGITISMVDGMVTISG